MNVYIFFACFFCLYYGCFSLETNATDSEEVYLEILRALSGQQINTTCENDLCTASQQGANTRTLRKADRWRLPFKQRLPFKNKLCLCPPCPDCFVNTQTSIMDATTITEEPTATTPEITSSEEVTTEWSRQVVKQEIAQLKKQIKIRIKYLKSHPPQPLKDESLQNHFPPSFNPIPPPRGPGRIPPGRLPPPEDLGKPPPPRLPPPSVLGKRPPPRLPPPEVLGKPPPPRLPPPEVLGKPPPPRLPPPEVLGKPAPPRLLHSPPQVLGKPPPPRLPPKPLPSRNPPPPRPPRPNCPLTSLGTLIDLVRRLKAASKSAFLKIVDPLGLNPLASRELPFKQSIGLIGSSIEDENDWKGNCFSSLPSNYKEVRIDDDASFSVLTD